MEKSNEITELLINLKINPNMAGFDYLRAAVDFCLKDEALKSNITTRLYPLLSKRFKTKPSIIERCIRFAITSAFENGGLLYLNNFYDTIVYKNNFIYSNAELISIIVEKIQLDRVLKKQQSAV